MDRRAFPRYPLSCVVAFVTSPNSTHLAVNLSRGGCSILMHDVELRVGQECSADLSLQIDVLRIERAVVRWIEDGHAGLEFVHIHPGDEAKLEAFLITVAYFDRSAGP